MICPICGSGTYVVSSRSTDETVVRWRKCEKCGQSIYTQEVETTRNIFKRTQNDYAALLKATKKELKKCKS